VTTTTTETTRHAALIGGEPVDPGSTFEDLDPATGEVLAEVARCGPDEVDAAVAAARAAQPAWEERAAADRAGVLRRIADAIRGEAAELARLETLDTGKPLSQAKADVDVAARYFDFYAGTIEAFYGDTVPMGRELFVAIEHEPHGVTGHIIPWNYPAQMVGRTIAPALATGNCCVLKPAEEAQLTALRIGWLALEAGLPAGAFNVVTGLGEEAGAALAAHPGIDHLSFTGSTEVGRLVGKAAAENIVPVTVELGGKSANIVLADADLERAVPVITRSIIQNAGQTCSAGARVLVQESLHERIRDLVAGRFRDLRLGPGLEDPDLGPLISASQRSRVLSLVDQGRAEASLVTGGEAPDDARLAGGFFFEPTLFDDVPPGATIAREEIFGPVLVMTPFGDVDEAMALADATDYGLVAGIWTRNVSSAHRLARRVRAGQVFVNGYGAGGGIELPFGGWKQSGHGREKGYEALHTYTRTKAIAITL
jgi:aldehyde dehydrogenase (NAD+)/betaine-aldehyde dehydrogenase